MLQCHHKLCWNEWLGHKGVPKIGWNHSQSENKLPKFQYEKTVFLTYIFMWPPLGEARPTEIKYNMLWLRNWKLLFHQDTKMQRNLHESVPQGLKIYYEGKTKWTMAHHMAWTLAANLHLGGMETSEVLPFNHLRSLNLY